MSDDTKRCPFCDEDIRVNARVCKHCNRDVDGEGPVPPGGDQPLWWNLSGPLESGTEVREYRIGRILGEGGMGEVYLAAHTMTKQNVAMKVISPELMLDRTVRRRFLEEGRVMAKLRHPNIVRLLTFFEEGRRLFLVMDFIDGPNLESILPEKQLPFDEAIRIMKGVLLALDFAHSQADTVVHRDIKPANIMLGKGGAVVVTDFGIAKAAGREKLTRTRGIVGTFEYMSPEQVQGGAVTPASDIYACGITLYHMVTGIVPYPQKTDGGFECMQAHVSTPLPPIREFREAIPDWLEMVIAKSLEKDPARRFSSAKAMLDALSGEAEAITRAEEKPAVEPEAEPVAEVEAEPVVERKAELEVEPETGLAAEPVFAGFDDATRRPGQVSRMRILKGAGIGLLALFCLIIAIGIIGNLGKNTGKDEWKEEEKKTDRLPKKLEKKAFVADKMTEKRAEAREEEKAEEPELASFEDDEASAPPEEAAATEPMPVEEPVVVSLGPKETIETAFKAVQSKNLVPILGLFPASYVKDIDGVVHAFADAMDRELFDTIVDLVDKTVKVAVVQKEGLAAMVTGMGFPVKPEDIEKAIDVTDEIWGLLKEMGLTRLANLKVFSLDKFGNENLPKLADRIWAFADSTQRAQVDMALAMLSGATIEVGDAAMDEKWGEVYRVSIGIAGDTEEGKMVKVDGKWVPIEMAEEWDEGMKEAHKGIREMKEELAKSKDEVMAQLAQFEDVIDRVEKSGDLSALQAWSGMMMGMPAAAP